MKIVLNGVAREAADSTTISSLLEEVGLSPDRVVVEVNLQIIDRQDFKGTFLKEGDQVEVIGFVGGGIV